MKKGMRYFLFFLLLAVPASSQKVEMTQAEYNKMMEQVMKSGNNYSQAKTQSWDARLKVISGKVLVKTAEGGDEWFSVEGVLPLDPDDVIKTSSDGLAEIYMDDKASMALGRNTEMEIASLAQEDAVFSINFGSLAAKIKHFLNEKQKFSVRTPTAVCAVRGTEFAVEYSQMNKETAAAVYDEGSVAVTVSDDSGKPGQEFLLEKNTELVISPDTKRFHPVPLFRMGKFRGNIRTMRKRIAALKGWRPRTSEKRDALRLRYLKGKVVRKQLQKAKTRKAVKKRPASRYGTGR